MAIRGLCSVLLTVIALVLSAGPSAAQVLPPPPPPPPPPPMRVLSLADQHARFMAGQYNTLKRVVMASAEKMPEEHYSFAPVPEVRTFGALLGHIVFGNYLFCAEAKGDDNPKAGVNFEALTTKAELMQATRESFAYCDTAFGSLTGTGLIAPIDVAGPNNSTNRIPAGNRLAFLVIHGNEHYGNIVTYLRIKGLVPPSSERAPGRDDSSHPDALADLR